MINLERLSVALEKLNINKEVELDKFEKYMEGVLEWNEKVNLTNITDHDEFIEKHYVDSIVIANKEEFLNADKIIDVGTGGGFPGIPLAILFPEKEFVLLDSLSKRLKIIDQLTLEIGINNVTTIHGRAEELAKKENLREQFDLCLSRAVANQASLSELCIPFVKKGGTFIAYKGPGLDEELENAKKAIEVLGGRVSKIEDANINDTLEHKLLFIDKIKNTPKKYPRKPGEPVRNPIK